MDNTGGFMDLFKAGHTVNVYMVNPRVIDIKIVNAQGRNIMKKMGPVGGFRMDRCMDGFDNGTDTADVSPGNGDP